MNSNKNKEKNHNAEILQFVFIKDSFNFKSIPDRYSYYFRLRKLRRPQPRNMKTLKQRVRRKCFNK